MGHLMTASVTNRMTASATLLMMASVAHLMMAFLTSMAHNNGTQLDGGVSMMSLMGYSQMVLLDPWLNMYAFDGSGFFEAGNVFVFLVFGILLFTRSPGSHISHMITSNLPTSG